MRYVQYKHYFQKNEFIRFFFEFSMILFISITFDNSTFFINKIFNKKHLKKKNSFGHEETLKTIENI